MSAPATPPMRFHVDAWDPSYGASMALEEIEGSTAWLAVDVETPARNWAPVALNPTIRRPTAVLFVDGVRRLDARVWVDEPAPDGGPATSATLGLVSSYAAGVVCCCDRAHVVDTQVRRGLFTTSRASRDIVTSAGTYPVRLTAVDPGLPLAATVALAVQRNLGELELVASANARTLLAGHGPPDEANLLVVDGPLRMRVPSPRTIGFVKSHRTTYLPPDLNSLVGNLRPEQRTPVFLIGTNWDRFTWYLRLPCKPGAPWAGVARLEASVDQPVEEVVQLANLSQAVLPRFASAEYKDTRAPQNLYPIAGLERDLRRRLGDQQILYRALRSAAQRQGNHAGTLRS